MVRLTDPALNDLQEIKRKKDPQVVRWVVKKCLLLERDPEAGEELRGQLIGFRKITVGDHDWRVVWRVTHDDAGHTIVDVAEIWAVGARSDAEVYQEMNQRVASLASRPHTVALADALANLGRAAQGLAATPEPSNSDIPDWLIHVLVTVVGMPREEVMKLLPEEAQALWTAYTTRPRS